MSGLSKGDLRVIEGDGRISDRRLAEILGYPDMRHVRRIIERHREEIERHGPIVRVEGVSARTDPKPLGGRPEVTNLLNEGQVLAVCMFARTERAADVREQAIKVFMAWRRGNLYETERLRQQRPDPFAAHAARAGHRAGHVAAHLKALPEAQADTLRLTHLPIWPSGRRPPWWDDLELRAFLTSAHRQMTLTAAVAAAQCRFDRVPSASSVQRYWARLDTVFGPKGAA